MCGRAILTASTDELRDFFERDDVPALSPRWNLAPSQPLLAFREGRRPELLTWGPKLVNARVETASTSAADRCLVVVDGFYEWRKIDRQPFLFQRADRRPFTIGGMTRGGAPACALVTCPAGDGMRDLHARQPLVVERADWARWLSGERLASGSLEAFTRHAVSRLVNSPRNDVPACVVPVEDLGPAQASLFGTEW